MCEDFNEAAYEEVLETRENQLKMFMDEFKRIELEITKNQIASRIYTMRGKDGEEDFDKKNAGLYQLKEEAESGIKEVKAEIDYMYRFRKSILMSLQ